MRLVKNWIKPLFLGIHKLGIRFGVFILPVHYYTPIPNILELEQTKGIWARKSELPGISLDLDEQCENLKEICMPYQDEYRGNQNYLEGVHNQFGPGYGYIEAQALHAVVRYFKPSRIIEVGSGVSTYCMLKAIEMNKQETLQSTQITSIEPHPSPMLRQLGGINLIANQVQTVPMDVFLQLGKGDLLFIDSSHTVKAGSDVNYLILEVLPRLHDGVIVHFHDINFPYDYQRNLLRSYLHWSEISLLRAFLIHNARIKVLLSLSYLHYDRQEVLRFVFPEYQPQQDHMGLQSEIYPPFRPIPEHFPNSIYFQVVGG